MAVTKTAKPGHDAPKIWRFYHAAMFRDTFGKAKKHKNQPGLFWQ